MAESPNSRLSVFLSYSREDSSELAHELRIALGLLRFDVRVDVANILAPELWQEKIDSLIDESAAFLLLLSPRAATSAPCQREWKRALDHHKRVVIVRTGGIEEAMIPPELASIQHILGAAPGQGAKQGSFAAMLQLVHNALVTDVEWIAEHNRLAGLARDWSQQPPAERRFYTLNAQQIERAQDWLSAWSADTNLPEPTRQHRDFIAASIRELQRRKWRRGAEIATVVALLAAAAGLVTQYSELQSDNRKLVAENEQLNNAARDELPAPGAAIPTSVVSTAQAATSKPAPVAVDAWGGEFGGPNRRKASDHLVALYAESSSAPEQRVEIVKALVGVLQPKDAITSYRVNLYALVTFARMPAWQGTDQQRKAVKDAATMHSSDPTYKAWATRALASASPKLL